MKCVAIVQARLGSTRLPGKVLLPLAGRPMIERVVERARRVPGLDEVVAATTDRPADDPLADCLAKLGVACYRGSEADVLDRYYQAARNAQANIVVRITADCPLLSPEVSGRVLAELLAYRDTCDYASNAQRRTFPRGLDTEAFTFEALARAHAEAHSPAEREHVTPYLYRSGKFRLRDVTDPVDRSDFRWTVDTPADLELVRRIYEALAPANPGFEYQDVLELLAEHPEWCDLNRDVRQKTLGEQTMQYLRELHDSDREQLLAWRNSPDVSRFMFTDRVITTEEHDRWFAGLHTDPTRRYWVIHHGSRDLGVANLADLDFGRRSGSFGIYLADPAFRGRGLGTLAEWELIEYAFGTLHLETLHCEVLAFNTRMIALQERFGFAEQLSRRRQISKGEETHEVASFQLLADAWRQARSRVFEQVLALEAKLTGQAEPLRENP